jgi:3-carboxy-cis,cis-muconate cycloisomerase
MPWHTNRLPVARLASALAMLAGVVGKIAGDITLHAPTEIGEVSERSEPGRGTSSAMPHKRNPVASVRALAAARQVAPIAGGILASMADHPFQRAAGAWQAEVPALNSMYGFVAVALESLADALDGLHVDVDRMRANLDPRGGWSAEAATVVLTPHLGREAARAAVTSASDAARTNGSALLDELRTALAANDAVPTGALDAAADPATLLGSAEAFIDRALAHYRESALHP